MSTLGDPASSFSDPLSCSRTSICAEKRRLDRNSDELPTRSRSARGIWDRGIRRIGVNVEGCSQGEPGQGRITNGSESDCRSIAVSLFRLLDSGGFRLSNVLSRFEDNSGDLDKLAVLEWDIVAQRIKEKKLLGSHGL